MRNAVIHCHQKNERTIDKEEEDQNELDEETKYMKIQTNRLPKCTQFSLSITRCII